MDVQCPHCGTGLRLADDAFGRKVSCDDCGRPFKVPLPEAKRVEPFKKSPVLSAMGLLWLGVISSAVLALVGCVIALVWLKAAH